MEQGKIHCFALHPPTIRACSDDKLDNKPHSVLAKLKPMAFRLHMRLMRKDLCCRCIFLLTPTSSPTQPPTTHMHACMPIHTRTFAGLLRASDLLGLHGSNFRVVIRDESAAQCKGALGANAAVLQAQLLQRATPMRMCKGWVGEQDRTTKTGFGT